MGFFASSDLKPEVSARIDGVEMMFPIELGVSYGYDPAKRELGIVVTGLRVTTDVSNPDSVTERIAFVANDHVRPYVIVSNLQTARRLAAQMRLPAETAHDIRGHLDAMARSLDSFVSDCFLGRIGQDAESVPADEKQRPVTSSPVPKATQDTQDTMIFIERDVSPLFGKPTGTCVIRYSLFSERTMYHALIVLVNGEKSKHLDIYKKEIRGIIAYLSTDNLAFEVCSFFGSSHSTTVCYIGAVLKNSLGVQTGWAGQTSREAANHIVAAPAPQPDETIPLTPVRDEEVTVYNGGYFTLRA